VHSDAGIVGQSIPLALTGRGICEVISRVILSAPGIGNRMVAKGDARTQREKFEQAARDLDCDQDAAHWDERLRKIAKQKPPAERGVPHVDS
jgi:hypothetical protein